MANLFAPLNRFIARLDSDSGPNQDFKSTGASDSTSGFQVLRSSDTSLALEPWYDFIIGLNGHNIDSPDPNLFATEVRNCAGSTISLGVYSVKGRIVREVFAPVSPATARLGVSLQWAPIALGDDVWHILDVIPHSPADAAGLLPYSDYVVGSPERALRGDSALAALIDAFLARPLRLWVYNNEYDVTRLVTLTPARDWGGDGSLGCVLGYGALHRVPAPLAEPAQAPGEVLFESGDVAAAPVEAGPPQGSAFLVPAEMNPSQGVRSPSPSAAPAGGPPKGRTKKPRAAHSTARGGALDDYFAEGEQKSREADNAPTLGNAADLPPPPKGSAAKEASASPASNLAQ